MKIKKGWNIIPIPIFCGYLWVKFTKNMVKDANNIGITIETNDYLGLSFKKSNNKGGEFCMMIRRNTPDIIAHEALHIVNMLLNDRNISINTTDDELQCYLLSWIVAQVEKINHN